MKLLCVVLVFVCCVGTLEASILRYLTPGYWTGENREHKPAESEWPPKFCNRLGCPKYKVIESHPDYELREYDMSKWVSTNAKEISWKQASYTLFMRLFNYIGGNNVKGEKVAMTAPVLMRIIPGQGPACEDDYTMSFFVDPSAGNPPQPKDSKVSITPFKKQRVYVRSFGGYAMWTFTPWATQARKLAAAIGDSSKYHTEQYYTAGYDSPMRLFNRHNEIWFIAKE